MSSNNIVITPSGYAKMILHASKHSTQPLSGLLVGKIVDNGNIFVSDVVPLTHTQTATLPHPIIEAGVRMVHSRACSEGKSVVGTYFANERFDDSDFGDLNKRMAKEVAKICDGNTSSNSDNKNSDKNNNKSSSSASFSSSRHVTILLDNAVLCADEMSFAGKVYNSLNGSKNSSTVVKFSTWNRDTGSLEALQDFENVKGRLKTIFSGKQHQLWDFEEHLENCAARDFYNPWI